jgi:hypothetical protein
VGHGRGGPEPAVSHDAHDAPGRRAAGVPGSGHDPHRAAHAAGKHEGDTVTEPQRDDRLPGGATDASSTDLTPPVPGQLLSATPFVTAIALSPILTLGLAAVEIRRTIEVALPGRTGVGQGEYTLSVVVGLLVAVGLVVLAWLDHRTLRARGVERPFHWAWSILSALVYLVGRSVVVRRRVGGSAAPLWLFLGVSVLGFAIVAIIATSSGVATMDRPPVDYR